MSQESRPYTRLREARRMARPYSWNHGLFGCCDDVGACLLVTCCPCVAAGKVAEHVGACCGGPAAVLPPCMRLRAPRRCGGAWS
jgi:hypothetical protein